MSNFFIRRPIVAMVISILIVLIGLVILRQLPVEEFPDVVPGQVTVTANYLGADALTVEQSVATPIEQQINGVENMLYLQSLNANDGRSRITTTFNIGTNMDIAAVNVQNRVALAEPQLPVDVVRQGLSVLKSQTSLLMVVQVHSPKKTYDDVFLGNYYLINMRDALLRVPGVGRADLFRTSDYAMRVWVNPDRLADLGLTPSDVIAAIEDQNVQAPAGQIGAEPSTKGQELTYTVRAGGRLTEPRQFEDIIVYSDSTGRQVKVRDVARVELGSQSYSTFTRFDESPSAAFAIYLLSGANAVSTAEGVRQAFADLESRFPPDMALSLVYDATRSVTASIDEIIETLVIAILLVTLVVFVFLQSWRATLIPLLTIPVSLIGAFTLFPALGFSINALTLFAIVLAIGIVVDDAIVVVEAVERHIEEGESPREAAVNAMREVAGPVVAVALILCSVFVPVAFMVGLTGRMYQQFGLTLAAAVLFSAFSALSLSPALSALILRPRKEGRGRLARVFGPFNRGFGWFTERYTGLTGLFIRKSLRSMVLFAVLVVVTLGLFRMVPSGFLPTEDRNVVLATALLPDGASLERTREIIGRIEGIARGIPGVIHVTSIGGFNLLTQTNSTNTASFVFTLEEWEGRTTSETSQEAIVGRLSAQLGMLPGAIAFPFVLPPITGLGVTGGFTFELQDRGGGDPAQLAEATQRFLAAARQRPELTNLFTGFRANVPQISAQLDREKALTLGVPVDDVYRTLQVFLGGFYVNDFNKFGRVYRVYVQAEPEYRFSADDIGRLFVRSQRTGEMVPLSTLVRTGPTTGPEYTTRYNLYRTAEISGQAAPGYSTGQALDAMEQVAADVLPREMGFEWTSTALQERQAAGQIVTTFGLAIVFVFLLLAALYESWSLPFSVLLGTPFAALGALLPAVLLGSDNNIYVQIGLIMLVGLAAKNSILIVEFAKRRYEEEGMPLVDAALEGARIRLRPILMTSFAFILGVAPLMFASGAGAASRRVIGMTVFSGMLVATLIGIFMIPVFFYVVERLSGWRKKPLPAPAPAPTPATKPAEGAAD